MKLILVFAFVFSLGVLTLLAESIPRQEDSQALVSKQDDHSVNYRSDSQNRLKRGTHSGLLNNHWSFDLLGDLLSRSSDAVVRLAHIFRGRARLSHSPTVPVLKLNHISNFSRRFFSEMIIVTQINHVTQKKVNLAFYHRSQEQLECFGYELLFQAL